MAWKYHQKGRTTRLLEGCEVRKMKEYAAPTDSFQEEEEEDDGLLYTVSCTFEDGTVTFLLTPKEGHTLTKVGKTGVTMAIDGQSPSTYSCGVSDGSFHIKADGITSALTVYVNIGVSMFAIDGVENESLEFNFTL
ncbi:MAG: hypothetical protein LUC49_06155 [Prevotella sp.]|nr:hypothetical protein [Prevotella sp.]